LAFPEANLLEWLEMHEPLSTKIPKEIFFNRASKQEKKTDFAFALVIAINNALPSLFNLFFNLHAIALYLALEHALALFLAPVPDLTLLFAADQFLPRQSRITFEFAFLALLI
jgi:hypothetical protein